MGDKIAPVCGSGNVSPQPHVSTSSAPNVLLLCSLDPSIVPSLILKSLAPNDTGAIVVVGPDAAATAATVSQLKILVRANWSNPPAHGARIVAITLADPGLRAEWFDALKTMSGRIQSMRQQLKAALVALGTPGTWDHITQQIGMFSFTGLSGTLMHPSHTYTHTLTHSLTHTHSLSLSFSLSLSS